MNDKTVLVVDDDDAFRTVLAGELSHRGFEVTSAATGAEALERVAAAEPKVVLLDLRLPDANGIDVLKAIRSRAPAVEVIMLTGHASVESGIQGMQLGAFDYVMKPVPLDELLDKMRQAYERKAMRAHGG